uniref:HMG box domain-containing protein n=1 Tax=viral metagenome TaxID=1070528 RepID=A0A6C0CDL3_9ZZZZ
MSFVLYKVLKKHKMTTISMKIKEAMANMPDTYNTKKEIDDYYKEAMKKAAENSKTKKGAKPSDDTDKPKKELNGYQLFMKEHIKTVKEENPSLTGPEVFSKIAELWKKKKEEAGAAVADVPTVVAAAVPTVVEVVVKEEDAKADAKADADDETVAKTEVKKKKAK